jgi:hypothetical protein
MVRRLISLSIEYRIIYRAKHYKEYSGSLVFIKFYSL